MKLSVLSGAFSLLPLVTAGPINPVRVTTRASCANPIVRKEWRSLTQAEQTSYLNAVKCLFNKAPLSSKEVLPNAANRYEDFVGGHLLQTDARHFVGTFYPWHRLMMWSYEQAIRECGFEGGQPYWDWSLDANSTEDMMNSKIWDAEYGFGGNGDWVPGTLENPEPGIPSTANGVPLNIDDRTGGGCIPDGPFANMTTHMGPGYNLSSNERCVRRDFVPSLFKKSANVESVAEGLAYPDFGWFSQKTEQTLHIAGHSGVGGLYGAVTDVYTSPADPIFFLHHTNLDRLWWSWQSKNLTARLTDFSGPVVPNDWSNEKGGNATLDDELYFGATVNVTSTVRNLMDIRVDSLCYTYAELY